MFNQEEFDRFLFLKKELEKEIAVADHISTMESELERIEYCKSAGLDYGLFWYNALTFLRSNKEPLDKRKILLLEYSILCKKYKVYESI